MKLTPTHHQAILTGLMSPDVQIDAEDGRAILDWLVARGFTNREHSYRDVTPFNATVGTAFYGLLDAQDDRRLALAILQAATRAYQIRLYRFPGPLLQALSVKLSAHFQSINATDTVLDAMADYFPNLEAQR